MNYSIESHQHGILVRGSIPIDDFAGLSKLWKRRGLKLMDLGVAQAAGATFAFVKDEKESEAWRAELDASASQRALGDDELSWLLGTDTGTSSIAIFAALTGQHHVAARTRSDRADGPHDPSDFGRCYRLLERFPSWRSRLPEVATKYPDSVWPALIERWADLETLWLEESPSGTAPKLYKLIRELRGNR